METILKSVDGYEHRAAKKRVPKINVFMDSSSDEYVTNIQKSKVLA